MQCGAIRHNVMVNNSMSYKRILAPRFIMSKGVAEGNEPYTATIRHLAEDKVRNELAALGFEVKDTKDGATWRLNK